MTILVQDKGSIIHSKLHKQSPRHTDNSCYTDTAQNDPQLSPMRTGSQPSHPVD